MSTGISAEKTLYDVLADLWCAKFYLLIFATLSLIASFSFILTANKYYRAEMVVAPAVTTTGHGGHISGYVGEGSTQVQPAVLESTAAFLQFENIFSGVAVSSILLKDKDFIVHLKEDQSFAFSSAPSLSNAEILSEYIDRHVVLEPVSGTPLRSLVYYHPDAAFAADFVGRVHRITDEIIRARMLRETSERIEYLTRAISEAQNPDHRRRLTDFLMEQEHIRMLVSSDQPYAARIIEFPHVSARPKWPDPYVVYPVFLLIGLLVGFLVYGIRHYDR